MILGPTWAFVENPRTGSTAARDALVAAGADGNSCRRHIPAMAHPNPPPAWVVVRNPFDRLVSGFFNWPTHATVLEFLTSPPLSLALGADFKRTPQSHWTDLAAGVLRYENLAEEFAAFCRAQDVEARLAVVNKSHMRRGQHYRDLICRRARAIIEDRFAADLAAFQYTW